MPSSALPSVPHRALRRIVPPPRSRRPSRHARRSCLSHHSQCFLRVLKESPVSPYAPDIRYMRPHFGSDSRSPKKQRSWSPHGPENSGHVTRRSECRQNGPDNPRGSAASVYPDHWSARQGSVHSVLPSAPSADRDAASLLRIICRSESTAFRCRTETARTCRSRIPARPWSG